MKKFIFLVLLSFYSCSSDHQSAELPDISAANHIKFSYKTDFDSTGRMKIKDVDLTDYMKVTGVKNIISYDPFTYVYCISSGSMSFYKDSTFIASMVFNTSKDFMHIACNNNGKLVAIKLSEENAKFLDSFKN